MTRIGAQLLNATRRLTNIGTCKYLTTSVTRRKPSAYDGPGKTTATILNTYSDKFISIKECEPMGFALSNGSFVIGPMVIFPKSIFSWNIASGKHIDEASLSLFLTLEPRPDLLVIGLEKHYELKEILRIKSILKNADIPSEVLPVKQAAAVYNFVAYEGRYVAAGMIPLSEDSAHRKWEQRPVKLKELENK